MSSVWTRGFAMHCLYMHGTYIILLLQQFYKFYNSGFFPMEKKMQNSEYCLIFIQNQIKNLKIFFNYFLNY